MGFDRMQLRWNGWGWAARKDDAADRQELWTWLATELGMPALLATPPRPLEELTLPASRLTLPDRVELSGIVGAEGVRDSTFERAFHARGRTAADLLALRAGELSTAPDAVIYPRSNEEVLAVLALAARRRIAVVPFGSGTDAGVTPARSEFDTVVVLDLTQMDRVIAIDPLSWTATAEAGITGLAFENALKAKGLRLDGTGSEFSTLGGRIGAGRNADWLIGAKLATPLGLVEANTRLTNLIAGSQGAFGIVTEATVRLRRRPAVCDRRGYLFRDFAAATAALRTAMQDGCGAAQYELCDAEETRLLSGFVQLEKAPARFLSRYARARGFADRPCLILAQFDGDAASAFFLRRRFTAIAGKFGVIEAERTMGHTWRQLHGKAPYWRDSLFDRGVGIDGLSTVTSWSRLAAVHAGVTSALSAALREAVPCEAAHGVVFGHVRGATPFGATLAFTWIYPRTIGGDIEQCAALKKAAHDAVTAAFGTGSGPDALQTGADDLGILNTLKNTLDPEGIQTPRQRQP